MANSGETETNCICRYTLAIMDRLVDEEALEIRDNYIRTLNIHEIDEDDDVEVCTPVLECLHGDRVDQIVHVDQDCDEDRKVVQEGESAYSDDSFCSESSSESSSERSTVDAEGLDATPRSLISSPSSPSSPPRVAGIDQGCDDADDDANNRNLPRHNVAADCGSSCSFGGNVRSSTSVDRSVASGQTRVRRKNMSFTDDEMRRIERENELLLQKIMAQRKPRNKLTREDACHCQSKVSSSAINRRKLQEKIEGDNLLLLRRIQQAKPRFMSNTVTPGYRLTFL